MKILGSLAAILVGFGKHLAEIENWFMSADRYTLAATLLVGGAVAWFGWKFAHFASWVCLVLGIMIVIQSVVSLFLTHGKSQ